MVATDTTVQRLLDTLLYEVEELRTIAKRTETRLCHLAQFMGAEHIGSPTRPTYFKRATNEHHD